jgi:hypothetical protein
MVHAELAYRWSRDEFVRAWEAGAFDRRVELVDGEVWPVAIGDWHGKTVGRVIKALPDAGVELTTATLATGYSLPDPDCWVRRADAEPIETIGTRLHAWAAEDVLLVIEVSDETVPQDLGVKAAIYGQAGYPLYWVVTQDVIYEHSQPSAAGFRVRVEYRRGERIPVPYAATELAVNDLLA